MSISVLTEISVLKKLYFVANFHLPIFADLTSIVTSKPSSKCHKELGLISCKGSRYATGQSLFILLCLLLLYFATLLA